MSKYPYSDGDQIVLGPEVFAQFDGSVICWKGENYYRLAEGREGILTVYDSDGKYRGCIGAASWDVLLAEGDAWMTTCRTEGGRT